MKYKAEIRVFLGEGKYGGAEFDFDIDNLNHHPSVQGLVVNTEHVDRKAKAAFTAILNEIVNIQQKDLLQKNNNGE